MSASLGFPKPPKTLRAVPGRPTVQSEHGRLVARAQAMCSAMTRDRARGRCEFCGGKGIETAHGFGKGSHPSTRFDERDLFWSCRPCHDKGNADRAWLADHMLRILGFADYTELARLSVLPMPYTVDDVIAAAKQGRFIVERAA